LAQIANRQKRIIKKRRMRTGCQPAAQPFTSPAYCNYSVSADPSGRQSFRLECVGTNCRPGSVSLSLRNARPAAVGSQFRYCCAAGGVDIASVALQVHTIVPNFLVIERATFCAGWRRSDIPRWRESSPSALRVRGKAGVTSGRFVCYLPSKRREKCRDITKAALQNSMRQRCAGTGAIAPLWCSAIAMRNAKPIRIDRGERGGLTLVELS